MDSSSDRKSIRAKEKQALTDAASRASVVRSVMSTVEGRSWLWHTLGSCHCFSTTFNGDPLQSAFNEGQRAIGLALLADIMSVCPDQYIQAMREFHERSATDERRRGPVTDRRDTGSGDAASEDGDPADRDPEASGGPGSDPDGVDEAIRRLEGTRGQASRH